MNKNQCKHEWVPTLKQGILECQKCKKRIQYTFSEDEIREGLREIELPSSYKDMRKMYDKNPKYQHVSFEDFVRALRKIKTIIDNAKLRYRVK